MLAPPEKLAVTAESSFRCLRWGWEASPEASRFDFRWHYHSEYELTLVESGRGKRFVGDHIGEFSPGDLVFLGQNLPHTYVAEAGVAAHLEPTHLLVVQFAHECFGAGFFEVPELQPVTALLGRARQGLQILGKSRAEIIAWMLQIPRTTGPRRVVLLLQILARLAGTRDARPLSSPAFVPSLRKADQQRIDRVCAYIGEQFTRRLPLPEVAARSGLSPSAFSRFFSRSTGKTFVDYLNELRIGRACALLMQTDRQITEISLEAGFNNLAHFNRTFRRLHRMSPRQYRAMRHAG